MPLRCPLTSTALRARKMGTETAPRASTSALTSSSWTSTTNGTPDWQDADDDNDSVLDAADCAPAQRHGLEPAGRGRGHGARRGNPHPSARGRRRTRTVYDVVTGALSELRAATCCIRATCRWDNGTSGSAGPTRILDPPSGDGRYYLARAQNVCGNGTWGMGVAGVRTIAACPMQGRGNTSRRQSATTDERPSTPLRFAFNTAARSENSPR